VFELISRVLCCLQNQLSNDAYVPTFAE